MLNKFNKLNKIIKTGKGVTIMESFIVKIIDGSWDTLRKISDITDIQIIDPNEFEIAIVFNENNIEFKDWILDELKSIDGIESIIPKEEVEKYSKVYHIQHCFNNLETLCGINGRLGLKIDFCEAHCAHKKLCPDCVEVLNKFNYAEAVDLRCEKIFSDDEDDIV